jgi:hypothetical protein
MNDNPLNGFADFPPRSAAALRWEAQARVTPVLQASGGTLDHGFLRCAVSAI